MRARNRLIVLVAVLTFAAAAWAGAVDFPPGNARELGFDTARLGRVDALFEKFITQGRLAGAVALVVRDGRAVLYKSYGKMDREAGIPMTKDAVFRIASMSKALTSTAVMILYEEGRFLLQDPLSKFIPEFADPVVATPVPEGSASAAQYYLAKVHRPITIHQLLTHTSGLTYGYDLSQDAWKAAGIQGWYLAGRDETIGDVVKRMAQLPLDAQPGEKWLYGYSSDVLGRLVEVVSGMPFDRFLEERLFKPLRMDDTSFWMTRDKAARFAPVYGLSPEGVLTKNEDNAKTDYLNGPKKCLSGGAGILSTAVDYGRFLQMLLNGGVLDGVRILSPKSVELMSVNGTRDLYRRDGWGRGETFGLGFWVREDAGTFGELGSKGSFGWGSAYYPIYWVDPAERMVGLFMTQLMPADDLPLSRQFPVLVYQALTR
jgi:CubicO group peptidase (beta-lactamase class C family)